MTGVQTCALPISNQSTLFSLYWNDDTALEDLGQYIFSTNNTGAWVNESAVNFTSTPQWANVTLTLNDTVGISIGWRMYADDNAGNVNDTEVFSLVTTKEEEDCWVVGDGYIYVPSGCEYYIDGEVYVDG